MKFAKRDTKGNVLGHFEPTEEQIAEQKVWTHKVRGDEKEKATAKASLKPPKGMKLLCVEEGASDEFGSHDLYVYGIEEIKYVDAEAEAEELTPRVGFESAQKMKEAASTPPVSI